MASSAVAIRRTTIACAVLVILSLPATALAQSTEREQDARIQQLEDELNALKQALSQQQDQLSQVRAEREAEIAARPPVQPDAAPLTGPGMQASGAVAAHAPAAGGNPKSPIQNTAIVSADSRFSYGGFIKLDMMSTRTSNGAIADGTPGRMFYFPTATPVGGGEGDSYMDFHAQFSRIWFGVDRVTDAGDTVKGYVEFDFFGGGNSNVGNEKFSNGYPPTLRHAYVQWNRWLAGQTWTNFMDMGSLPESVDFVGIVDGTVFARQAQLRYTQGPWSFSLENPQTWYQAGSPAHTNSGENALPDMTARWQTRGDWGHFSVAGLARQLRTRTEKTNGYALSVAGSFKLGERDLMQYTFSGGPGLGRYIGFGMAPDAYLDPSGELQAQGLYAGFAAWRHNWNNRLRSTLAYSAAYIDTDALVSGGLATKRTQSWRGNLIYSPFPRLDLGAEISWAKREVADGQEGELSRLQTTVKYTF